MRATQAQRWLVILAALIPPALTGACPLDNLPTQQLTLGEHTLQVERAETPTSRQCGLSRRHTLAADHGMLFVFAKAVQIPFWMKDTYIPLSIAFIDDNGRILAIQDMVANDSITLHHPPSAYRYALETTVGWFKAHGVQSGDVLNLDFDQTH